MLPKIKQSSLNSIINVLIWAFVIALSSGSLNSVFAQCDKELAEAEQNYNNGRFDEAIQLITGCLDKPSITEDEKKQAYRLLGLTYIAQDYLKEAKAAVRRLLTLIPNYKADTVQDPPSFANLVKEVRDEMESEKKPAQTTQPVTKRQMVSTRTSQSSPLKFGFRGGLNMANISEDLFGGELTFDVDGFPITLQMDQGMRTTFGFGGFIEYWISPMFAFQFNFLYNNKGVKITGDIDENIQGVNVTGTLENTIKLSYLSIPILAKLSFGQSGSIQPYFIFGPEMGILLSAKNVTSVEVSALGQSVSDETEIDIKDGTESMEFAINFGAGLTISLGSIEMFIDGMYGLGLSNIIKDSDQSVKNNVIYINLGFVFGQ